MRLGSAVEGMWPRSILDLNGWKLGGLAAGTGTQADGIFALNRQNMTIKNGIVRGFLSGIWLAGAGSSQGLVVEDIRADQNAFRRDVRRPVRAPARPTPIGFHWWLIAIIVSSALSPFLRPERWRRNRFTPRGSSRRRDLSTRNLERELPA